MGEFHKVKIGDKVISPIDWEMSPDISFGTFESWGGRERVRNNNERVYYFFVDNWGEEPKLCLMERAVKHAKIMAEIKAPQKLIEQCVKGQGRSSVFEKSYAINDTVKAWLIDNVLDDGDSALIMPRVEEVVAEDMGPQLPDGSKKIYSGEPVHLPAEAKNINDDQIGKIIRQWNFYDTEYNPAGRFENVLVAAGDPEAVIDQRTSLMWQRHGIDIGSIRMIQRKIDELNSTNFAGYADWRLPTMEEAMSLMEPVKNEKGVYLDQHFSKEQPFIFVAAQRKPGGYWFVDFKQGRAFWSSGTIPGGFARVVRSVTS
ncbi:MAG: Lcl C-terminal domain-containing protein [Desulforhopalus sp.]